MDVWCVLCNFCGLKSIEFNCFKRFVNGKLRRSCNKFLLFGPFLYLSVYIGQCLLRIYCRAQNRDIIWTMIQLFSLANLAWEHLSALFITSNLELNCRSLFYTKFSNGRERCSRSDSSSTLSIQQHRTLAHSKPSDTHILFTNIADAKQIPHSFP